MNLSVLSNIFLVGTGKVKMNLNEIKRGFVNVSDNLYDSEFLNLVNIKNSQVSFDETTLFLTDLEKEELNKEPIVAFNDFVAVINIDNHYGLICDVPIAEYKNNSIKSHELVLPDIIQGMLSNFQEYNSETAPVLLLHDAVLSLSDFIVEHSPLRVVRKGKVELYIYSGAVARELLNSYESLNSLYIGDGHHRLYSTSISRFKKEMLAMLMDFDQIDIQPINREIIEVPQIQFDTALKFLQQRFQTKRINADAPSKSGYVNIFYKRQSYQVKLIELLSDGFWNNDIYRLNTQIISQAFRIFDNSRIKFLDNKELNSEKIKYDSESVLLGVSPMTKEEFIVSAQNGNVLPPKTTWMHPKCPSFLIIHKYDED